MSLRKSGANCPNDAAKLMRRGVLALVVLLLACVLMAGAVSAEDVSVSNWADLKDNLTKSDVTKITLTNDIVANSQVNVTYGVTIDGGYHTLSANPSVTWGADNADKHLLQLTNKTASVTIENLILDSKNKAGDLHVYDTGSSNQIILKNLKINGSNMMGLHVNAANVSATNITIEKSAWGISVDVQRGKDDTGLLSNTSSFYIDTLDNFRDLSQISDEEFSNAGSNAASVFINGEMANAYVLYKPDEKDASKYVRERNIWINSTYLSFFNATVQNTSTSTIDLHTDLSKALSSIYAASGATVTLLKDVTTTETITIDKKVTLDLNGHKITATDATAQKSLIMITGESAALTLSNSHSSIGILDECFRGVEVTQGTLTVNSNVKINASYDGIRLHGSGTDTQSPYSTVTINEGATVAGGGYGVIICGPALDGNYGYGAKLDITGTVESTGLTSLGDTEEYCGIFVMGNLGGTQRMTDNIPQIIIHEKAKVSSPKNAVKSALGRQAIAGNGQVNVTIEGEPFPVMKPSVSKMVTGQFMVEHSTQWEPSEIQPLQITMELNLPVQF